MTAPLQPPGDAAGHAHGHGHPHGHGGHGHAHAHPHGHAHSHGPAHGGHAPGAAPGPARSLLMAGGVQRLLGALALVALLWAAVAWAVMSGD